MTSAPSRATAGRSSSWRWPIRALASGCAPSCVEAEPMRISRARAFARAALLGNPSDGYGGRTISFAFTNFEAGVVVYEWPRLEILPGPSDQVRFANLHELVEDVEASGYYGGLRLVKAALKRFADWCGEHSNRADRTFSIRYQSSIP